MPPYLKVVDKYPTEYTFCWFGGLTNGLPSPTEGCQQPAPKTSVSLELLYAI